MNVIFKQQNLVSLNSKGFTKDDYRGHRLFRKIRKIEFEH